MPEIKQAQNSEVRNLVNALMAHMKELGYRPHTILSYKTFFIGLVDFCELHSNGVFTIESGHKFLWESCGMVLGDADASAKASRVVQLVADFQKHGRVFLRTGVHQKDFTDAYRPLLEGAWESFRSTGVAESTIQKYRQFLFRFEHFLTERGVERFDQLELHHVNAYVDSLASLSRNTVRAATDNLKRLFAYACAHGYHSTNYSGALPAPSYRMHRRLPETFTETEVEQILENIDRNNPLGKRNYAITILVARLGLRLSDVLRLTFDSIDWDNKHITIVQQKTGVSLELPLPEDAGWAVIDYLKHGRPESTCQCIFIRHCEPYGMLRGDFTKLISDTIQKAGVKPSPNNYIGMHNLRHSIATSMFSKGTKLTDLSQILGHTHRRSTERYIGLNVEALRECALEVLV